jgi:hypothetical protein
MAVAANDHLRHQIAIARAALPTRPGLRLASVTAADGEAIYLDTDRSDALRWAETTDSGGTVRTIRGQFDTVPGNGFPLLIGRSVTFSEGGEPYLRLSSSVSWDQRTTGSAIAALGKDSSRKYAAFSLGMIGDPLSGRLRAVAEVFDGTKPRTSEREVSALTSPVSDLAEFRAGELGEHFREELERAGHFEPLLARIQAAANQRLFVQLGIVATLDDLWRHAIIRASQDASLPSGPQVLERTPQDIRDNATTAKRWFNVILIFDATVFGVAGGQVGGAAGAAIIGGAAAGAAWWVGDVFNQWVDKQVERVAPPADVSSPPPEGSSPPGEEEGTEPPPPPPPPSPTPPGGGGGGGGGTDDLDHPSEHEY